MLTNRWPLHGPTNDWRQRHRLIGTALQWAWTEYLGRLEWQLFVTLTFDPKRVFPVSHQLASREAFTWCHDTARIYRRPLGWIYAPERGASGLWHVHVLMIGAPAMIHGKPFALREAAGMWTARNGRIEVRRVDNTYGVTFYTTKQAADAGELVWSDTLAKYRDALLATPTVNLFSVCPEVNSEEDRASDPQTARLLEMPSRTLSAADDTPASEASLRGE